MKKFILLLMILISWRNANAFFPSETINIAISATPNNLVPFFSTDANSQNINRLIHLSLVDVNGKMEFSCVACEAFYEKMQGEKHIFIFKLREDLRFSDGTAVTVLDVRKSYEYFSLNKEINSTFRGAYEAIEDVRIRDKNTVEFIFKRFSLENISNLSLLKIVKLKKSTLGNLAPMDVLGCGDYVLEKILPLEILLAPRIKTRPMLNFKVVKDETTLALKLINNEIDLSVASISPRKTFWLRGKTGIKVWEKPSGNFQFLGLNHKREIFKDRNVRHALSLLIPREEILKYKLKNTAVLSEGMFSSAFVNLHGGGSVDPFDEKKAIILLKNAGWVKNKNGFLEKDKKQFEIDWKVSNNKASIEIVEVIKHFLEKAGIVVHVSIQEWGTYMNAFKSGKFDIVAGQWVGFTGPDMMRFVFHSTNTPPKGGNRTGYENRELDNLLDLATVERDEAERTKRYKEALKIINDDYAYINLWHPSIIWIGRSCLSDIELESSGSFLPLKKLEKKCGKK